MDEGCERLQQEERDDDLGALLKDPMAALKLGTKHRPAEFSHNQENEDIAVQSTSHEETHQTNDGIQSSAQISVNVLAVMSLSGGDMSTKYLEIEPYCKHAIEVFQKEGFEEYEEKKSFRKHLVFRNEMKEFPTSWLSYLQRVYALVKSFPSSEPSPLSDTEYEETFNDELMENAMEDFESSHLLSHATEGFFLPIEMDGPPLFDTSGKVPGGWIGSSYKLREELLEISGALGIDFSPLKGAVKRGGGYDLNSVAIHKLNSLCETKELFYREKLIWFALYEATCLSIAHKSAIILY